MSNTIEITNLSEYIKAIEKIREYLKCSSNNKMDEVYFRGQSKRYPNSLPTVFRNQKIFSNEDQLLSDFMAKEPELFEKGPNNF